MSMNRTVSGITREHSPYPKDVAPQSKMTLKQRAEEILRERRKRCAVCGKVVSRTRVLCAGCSEIMSLPTVEVIDVPFEVAEAK